MNISVPRDASEKKNELITILCEELCLAYFDQDQTGKAIHLWDLTKKFFPIVSRSYSEIKKVKHLQHYIMWAMVAICWNNRAKMVAPEWFENPNTATEAINDSLPIDSVWENRKPGKFSNLTNQQRNDWILEVEKAKWAVNHLRGWFHWDDQKIIDRLYNESVTTYVPRSVETAIHEIDGSLYIDIYE